MLKTDEWEMFGRAGVSPHLQVAPQLTLRARKQDLDI